MEVEEIKTSRWKNVFSLLISLAFVLISVAIPSETIIDSYKSWLVVAFFGLCSVVFAFLLVRPQRLLLTSTAFAVAGGFIRTPKQILWRDVNPLFVCRLVRGGKIIGYNFALGARKDSTLIRGKRILGAEGVLPKGWPGSPEQMVERINAYRAQALVQDANSEAGAV